MLNLLRVENLSVIESVTVEFGSGLNIITGETGAGKSVFIGALKLLLGERFTRTMLRDEEKKLVVEGVFNSDFEQLSTETKEQFDIEDEVIIRREVDSSGKNRVYINGKLATVAQLKDISERFADIHGQHEHQRLLDPACHIEFLDAFTEQKVIDKFKTDFNKYLEKKKALEKIKSEISNTLKEKDILEFQLDEIEAMHIDVDYDENLEDKIKMLSHMEKIIEAASTSLIYLRDGEINISELLGSSISLMSSVADYSLELSSASDGLSEASSHIMDVTALLEKILEMQELDPEELNRLVERRFRLAGLMKKYSANLSELLLIAQKTKEKLDNLCLDESSFQKMEQEVVELKNIAENSAKILNETRKKSALKLSEEIIKNLSELELQNSVFSIEFFPQPELDEQGGIRAEFYISTNPGFPPAPLAKVASGGEISRVMLSLKNVFAESDKVGTLVFDEIDTGISGKTARQVAKKLASIASCKQVIVITHLAVVAAEGETQFHISKGTDSDKAKTEVSLLTEKEREGIIALMIAGEKTLSSIEQAKELLAGRGC